MYAVRVSSWEVLMFTKPELWFAIPFGIFVLCLVLLGVFF